MNLDLAARPEGPLVAITDPSRTGALLVSSPQDVLNGFKEDFDENGFQRAGLACWQVGAFQHNYGDCTRQTLLTPLVWPARVYEKAAHASVCLPNIGHVCALLFQVLHSRLLLSLPTEFIALHPAGDPCRCTAQACQRA